MCQSAYKCDTNEELETMADLKRFCNRIIWDQPADNDFVSSLTDNSCLCHVNLASTLVEAGYKVWANPDVLPEYLFESVTLPSDTLR